MLNICEFKLVSSLEKILPMKRPKSMDKKKLTGLKGETLSFQLAHTIADTPGRGSKYAFKLEIDSKLRDNMKIRKVELVPSLLPAYESRDTNYIATEPGVLPDLLTDFGENIELILSPDQWRALWIDIELTEDLEDEDYQIKLRTLNKEDELLWEDSLEVEVIGAQLPDQELIHTEWFHGDCLADYYNVDVWSEKHWEILENFIEAAGKHGINMLLTPVFTPPLDTAVGGERTTIQLVDISLDKGKYSFGFDRLERWAEICKKHGIKYLEIVHFFTQWGARYTPKIMAQVDGQEKRIFGWDVEATDPSYKKFLDAFIPELLAALKTFGFDEENTYFHISDEPRVRHLGTYRAAKDLVKDHLEGYTIIDALSSYEFYKEDLINNPIPANNFIQDFIDEGVEDLWVYYCCSQPIEVSNRFMAMPSARNRIIGVQMYLEEIVGFLHWGYNFYNSQYSIKNINPYANTDAGGAFPSGDTFLVYPGEDGKPEESIRLMVFSQALYDLRAFKLLESLTSRDFVVDLIHEDLDYEIRFDKFPVPAKYIEDLRFKVNKEIKNNL